MITCTRDLFTDLYGKRRRIRGCHQPTVKSGDSKVPPTLPSNVEKRLAKTANIRFGMPFGLEVGKVVTVYTIGTVASKQKRQANDNVGSLYACQLHVP